MSPTFGDVVPSSKMFSVPYKKVGVLDDEIIPVNPDPSPTNADAETVPDVSTNVILLSPSLILLEASTIALAPITVALLKLFELTFAFFPIRILFEPVVNVSPALYPKAVFPLPVELIIVCAPIAVF